MLENLEPLRLDALNDATLAFVEMEYNRKRHRELGCSPLERFLAGPDVSRNCPDSQTLRRAFRASATRNQRRSDGTCSLAGTRFEVPSRYRHIARLRLRYARWDLSAIELVDPRTEQLLATLFPLDKHRNAELGRRALAPLPEQPDFEPIRAPAPNAIAPLLKHLIAEYAATGLPPPYIPFDPQESES